MSKTVANTLARLILAAALENSWITLLHEVEHVLEELVQGDETEAEARERYIGATDTPRFIFYRDTFGVGLKR